MAELARLTWEDVRDLAIADCVALFPVGAVEQHGPVLPLGTDWYIAAHIARRAAEARGRLLLPGIAVGVSHEHRQFWGTLTLRPEELRDHAVSVCRSLASHGCRRVVFVNGHGSNCAPLREAVLLLREESVYAYAFNWWQSIAETLAPLFPEPTAHGGSIETSAMLAIEPALVREDRKGAADKATAWGRFVEGVEVAFDTVEFSERGNVGDPALADVSKGRILLSEAVATLDRFCAWLAAQSEETLRTRPHRP